VFVHVQRSMAEEECEVDNDSKDGIVANEPRHRELGLSELVRPPLGPNAFHDPESDPAGHVLKPTCSGEDATVCQSPIEGDNLLRTQYLPPVPSQPVSERIPSKG